MSEGKPGRHTKQPKHCFRGSKKELAYVDYWHKLSPKEKAWLERFNAEFVKGSFARENGQRLHRSQKLRRECFQRNNAANRDVFHRMQRNVYREEETQNLDF